MIKHIIDAGVKKNFAAGDGCDERWKENVKYYLYHEHGMIFENAENTMKLHHHFMLINWRYRVKYELVKNYISLHT
jgi:hypothetical protein